MRGLGREVEERYENGEEKKDKVGEKQDEGKETEYRKGAKRKVKKTDLEKIKGLRQVLRKGGQAKDNG